MNSETEIQRRWAAFQGEFDQDVDLVNNIHSQLGELMRPIIGWDSTDASFLSVLGCASISVAEGCSPTTEATRLGLEAKKTATYRWLATVYLYAYWGLETAPDGSLQCDSELWELGGYRESNPWSAFRFLTSVSDKFANALRAAIGRGIIDGLIREKSLTPAELAALARIDVKSLKNSLTPSGRKNSGLRVDAEGNITRDSAKAWLLARGDFLATISGSAGEQGTILQPPIAKLDDVFFVPVADDGSAFTPDIHKDDGRYYVETVEGEIALTNYSEALRHLTVASVPAWRRPGPGGRWMLVRGNGWKRVTKSEVGMGEIEP